MDADDESSDHLDGRRTITCAGGPIETGEGRTGAPGIYGTTRIKNP